MAKKKYEVNNHLRIPNFPKELSDELKTITTKLAGQNKNTAFLKPKIRDFINSFPTELKQEIEKDYTTLCLSNFSKELKKDLKNISNYLGVDVSSLLKIEIYRIIIANKK